MSHHHDPVFRRLYTELSEKAQFLSDSVRRKVLFDFSKDWVKNSPPSVPFGSHPRTEDLQLPGQPTSRQRDVFDQYARSLDKEARQCLYCPTIWEHLEESV